LHNIFLHEVQHLYADLNQHWANIFVKDPMFFCACKNHKKMTTYDQTTMVIGEVVDFK
jgi:hypothetical protein